MDKKLIQDLKNAWRNCNSATVGFLQNVAPGKLYDRPFSGRFKTFAWEFADLLRTRMCYLRALETGRLSFADDGEILSKEEIAKRSKQEILSEFSDLSNKILGGIERIKEEEGVRLIIWLLQHERIHHGKLVLYNSQAGFAIPESFVKTWGESNFPSKK